MTMESDRLAEAWVAKLPIGNDYDRNETIDILSVTIADLLVDVRNETLEEAAKIVVQARLGEADNDLRSIIYNIRALKSSEQP